MYFKVFLTHFWRKESVRIRRRICVVLPTKISSGYWVMRSISATRTLILRTEESTAEIMGALD